MRASFAKLTPSQAGLASTVNYGFKLGMLDEATATNAIVANGIADLAVRELGANASEVDTRESGSLFRTRETMLHFVRDWSEEGASERNIIFQPILDVLRDVPESERGYMTVLIPGSGLARLAWEISQLGTSAYTVLGSAC
jgi:carnosine N-methyltransferase